MSKWDKVYERVMDERGTFDRDVRFGDLKSLLHHLGYAEEQRGGSHVIFRKGSLIVANLQRTGKGMAKEYQVRQVREFLIKEKTA